MEIILLTFPPVVIPAAALIYGLLHSVTASSSFKATLARRFGDSYTKYYRLLYSLFSAITLLPVITLPFIIPDLPLYTIPQPYVYLTGLIQLVAAGLLGYSLLQTGAMQFIGIPQALGRPHQEELNTSGLYRYVRHPLYTFGLVFIWLSPVMTRNLALLFGSFTVYIVIGALLEERKLLAIFGERYEKYRTATPFLIPFLF